MALPPGVRLAVTDASCRSTPQPDGTVLQECPSIAQFLRVLSVQRGPVVSVLVTDVLSPGAALLDDLARRLDEAVCAEARRPLLTAASREAIQD